LEGHAVPGGTVQTLTFPSCAAIVSLFALSSGCQQLAGQTAPGSATGASAPPAASSSAPMTAGSAASGHQRGHRAGTHADVRRSFGLPFVREPGAEDPFDRARGFLREALSTNASFVRQHDAAYFKPFLDAQKPRATVVTCSDSRVQSPALDDKPDNDLFTIRNIGNQIATSEGSVEYGVEHLKTPVLLVLGHSGCGAVKAALGDHSAEPEAIQRELSTLDLSPLSSGKSEKTEGESHPSEKRPEGEKSRPVDSQAIAEGVVVNVHRQVNTALAKFAEQVAGHELVVVGAVYDFRNELRKKHGTIHIINVNGNKDDNKISAFLRAVRDPLASTEAQPSSSAAAGASSRMVALRDGK
jgi:carbonic anhydrase